MKYIAFATREGDKPAYLGEVEATSQREAERKADNELWDDRLTAADCRLLVIRVS